MEKAWKEMHRALIIKAFAKAEQELIATHTTGPTKTKMACHLEDYLFTTHNYPYSYKSLVTLYNNAQVEEEVIVKKPEVINLLSKYLEFEDFATFSSSVKQQEVKSYEELEEVIESDKQGGVAQEPNTKSRKNAYQVYIVIAVILSLGILALFQFYGNNENQRWLRWNEDHYEEVAFNKTDYKNGILKLHASELLKFRKIQVDVNTDFFNNKGVPIVWYFKHASGNVEFFDSYGLHPTQNKYVKPVTEHIINKYVINNQR
jgi:flagellar basal body-associated protein FliL